MSKSGNSKRLFEDKAPGNGVEHGHVADKRPRMSAAAASNKVFQLKPIVQHGHKRTNDEVHSDIHLCPVAAAFIDTPQFQRLRSIKQLGASEHVYMNTNHNRFEHSLGVYWLAERMARRIHKLQPQLGCTEKDILCIRLAGLLHDIGHGPFSHIYDGEFVGTMFPRFVKAHPHVLEKYKHLPTLPDNWCHESCSLMMIDALLEHLGLQIDLENLDKPLKQIGDGIDALTVRVFDNSIPDDKDAILTSRDMIFVKECIWGEPIPELQAALQVHGFVGRPAPEKEWLYSIVSNHHSGLDVDKIDYFARDERRAKNASGQIDNRVIQEAFVTWGSCPNPADCFRCKHCISPEQHLMICYPEKMVKSAMSFFKKRSELHSEIYKHQVTAGATYLLCDILCHADPYFRIPVTSSGFTAKAKLEYDALPISRAMLDPSAFLQLKDSIIDVISYSQDPNLVEAQELIKRWQARQFYNCVADRQVDMNDRIECKMWAKKDEEIKDEMLRVRGIHGCGDGSQLVLELQDIIVQRCNIHCGLKDKNPVSRMRFLPKAKLQKLTEPIESLPEACEVDEITYQAQLPSVFEENRIRIFSRNPLKDGLVEHVFALWLGEFQDEMGITLDVEDAGHVDHVLASPPVMLTQESDHEDFGEDEDDYNYAHPSGARNSVTPTRAINRK